MKNVLFFVLVATVALVSRLPAAETATHETAALRKMAIQIDRQVASFYRNRKLPVPEVTDDATFLRRVFLVSIGRIPTSEEALAFLEIDDPAKREAPKVSFA